MNSSCVRVLLSGFIVVLAIAGHAFGQEGGRQVMLTPDSDYFGFDLRTEKDVTLEQCQAECLRDPGCRAFTYNGNAGWCFLKSDYSEINPFPGATAGKVIASTGEADIGAPPRLSFVPSYVIDEGRQYRIELIRTTIPDPSIGLAARIRLGEQALSAGNPIGAIDQFRAALAIAPDDGALWGRLVSAALAAGGQQGINTWQMKQIATSAAINAYEMSRHARGRADALALLASALEWREIYRSAISAFAASLELADNAAVRARYEDLRRRQGFRVIDHTIDSDSRNPRVCVQFSEVLVRSGVDYANYVALDGQAAENVSAGERELCVEGLVHGNRYRLELRAGLPSAIGEVIANPVVLDLYIRDRAAFVRFTGDNFVLPAAGRHGIPLVTVNTAAVEVDLYRIGDRALAGILGRSQFLRQIDGYEAMTLAEESGEAVWSGTLETAIEQNEEVTTSFPVDEALPERRPGVYVLTARPAGAARDDWETQATQWFVLSDIGLTAVSGEDGLHLTARSLADAEPLAGIEVELIARNNDVLGTATTDAAGQARFEAGLLRGNGGMAPQAVLARGGSSDFVFLDMGRAGFDLSDRGVDGRPAPGALDVMAWTERGIYRAGETVHVTALARDGSAEAVEGLPLTFVFLRPDGAEYRRIASADPSLGGYVISLPMPENAMRGAWTVRVHTDPERPAVSEKMFLVEDFIPDRVEFDMFVDRRAIAPGEPLEVAVEGRFLYGAPAAGLALEGEVNIRPTREWPGIDGYRFGLADEEEGESARIQLDDLPVLDEQGMADFVIQLDTLPSTTGLLSADISLRLREGGGRAVERRLSVPVRPSGPVIGIAPGFEGDAVPENTSASFRIIAVEPDDTRIAVNGAKWSLLRVVRDFQWYREGSGWNYEAVDYTTLIADGVLDIPSNGPAELSVPVGWGRYRLEVESADAVSSFEFDAGWFVEAASTDTPDGLEIALDKDSYMAGEIARLRVSPRFAGLLQVTVGADTVLDTITADVPEDGATIDIPVGEDWGAGAYVTATLFRPGDAARSRLPMRAIGVKWLAVDPGERKLSIAMEVPDRVEPDSTLIVPIAVGGADVAEKAFVTVAAVDVGILNLTRYEAPDPHAWYFGQRRLGLQIRDLYGRLIDGSAGAAGRIRSGGDGPGMMAEGSPPTERLVAFYSGIVELDPQGRATVRFDLPRFNGTVRLMAVAWTRSGVGNATAEVIVRDPVVISASMPKFLAPGDAADMRIDLAGVDAPDGEYRLSVGATGAVSVPPGVRTIRLEQGVRAHVLVPVNATKPGHGQVTISLEGDDGMQLEQLHELPVRPATLPVARRLEVPLAADGGSLLIDAGLLEGHLIEGSSVSVNVSGAGAFDIPALLMSLDRYPYGCAEQLTSRALPLLYLSELSAAAGMEEDADATRRVQDAVYRVLSFQSSSGSFGLWGPGSGDLWLDAYVTDFLTRARERRFEVPDAAMRLALDSLQNTLTYTNDIRAEGSAIAYALYVLARNRRASAGDLRYYADTQIEGFASPMARAHIGASLALYGDGQRAASAFDAAYRLARSGAAQDMSRDDYGSALRDNAAVLALAAESGQSIGSVPAMVELVATGLAGRHHASTQEQAWLLLAARAIQAGTPISIAVDGLEHSGNFARRIAGSELAESPVTVVNRGDNPVSVVVTAIAAPEDPLPAGGNGFSIERTYYTQDGEVANVSEARQNERFVVVLRVTEDNAWPSRVMVSDLLPAGFEIDNPNLVDSAGLSGFDWLPQTDAAHLEFRDDRFIAAFDRGAGSDRTFTLAYVVRAVTPGVFAHPPASVEDMYRPEFSARTAAGYTSIEAR